jgi:hypothetical protein
MGRYLDLLPEQQPDIDIPRCEKGERSEIRREGSGLSFRLIRFFRNLVSQRKPSPKLAAGRPIRPPRPSPPPAAIAVRAARAAGRSRGAIRPSASPISARRSSQAIADRLGGGLHRMAASRHRRAHVVAPAKDVTQVKPQPKARK